MIKNESEFCLRIFLSNFRRFPTNILEQIINLKADKESTRLFGKVFGFGIKLVSSSCLFWSFSLSNTSALSTKLITVQWALFWLVCLFFQLFFLFLSLYLFVLRALSLLFPISFFVLFTISLVRATFCRIACLTAGHGRSQSVKGTAAP